MADFIDKSSDDGQAHQYRENGGSLFPEFPPPVQAGTPFQRIKHTELQIPKVLIGGGGGAGIGLFGTFAPVSIFIIHTPLNIKFNFRFSNTTETRRIVTFLSPPQRRLVILTSMAKEKTIKENIPEEEPNEKFSIGSTVYMLSKEDFESIVAENIKVQEANLNMMKKIAGSLFGHTL